MPYALHCNEYQDLADIVAKGNHAGMKQLKDVKDPTQAQDAVTKHYLDSVVAIVSALAGARVKDTAASACVSFTWPRTGLTYNSSGIYFDTIKNACGAGCDTVVSLRLSIVDGPAVTLGEIGSSLGTTTCAGQSATLAANVLSHTGSLSYAWTKTAGATLLTDNSMAVATNNLTAGDNTYSVTVTASVAGCGSANASKNITISAASASAVTLNDITSSNGATICTGSYTDLTASASTSTGTVSYVWTATPSATAGMSATTGASITATPTATASHTYTVVATAHQDGCVDATDTKQITIGVDYQPELTSVAISSEGDETEFCEGESNTLTANNTGLVGTASYQWKKNGVDIPSATNSTYTATEAGSYTVVVTASNGTCANVARTSAAKVMTVAAAPDFDFEIWYDVNDLERFGNDAAVTVAVGDNVQLQCSDAGDVDSYSWTLTGDGTFSSSSANVDISTSTPGIYEYNLTAVSEPNGAGCQKTVVKTITVTVEDPCAAVTTPTITGSTTICPDSYSTLSVSSPVAGVTYHWYKGSDEVGTGSSYNATTAGTYKVRGTKDACTSDYSNTITTSVVSINPSLSFTGTPYSGNTNSNIPVQVSVGTLDGGTNGGYTWNIVSSTAAGATISNGSYSYQKNVSATGAGTVNISCTMTVNKSGCSKDVTANASVTVNSCSVSISSLSWTRQGQGLPNAPIVLKPTFSASGYTSLSWSWSRYNGSGSGATGGQTPSYIIENTQNSKNAFILSSSSSSQYWGVTLTASNGICSVSKTYISVVAMSSNYTSSGSFTLNASKSGTKGLSITASGSVGANSYLCVSVVPLSNTECVDNTNPCYIKSSSTSKTSWSASYTFDTAPKSGTNVRVYGWLSSSSSCTMASYGKSALVNTTVSY